MEKQPDLQVLQGTEKIPGSRRSTESLNRIIGTLAERPQGVSSNELAAECQMDHAWAYGRLHQRMKAGMLVARRGNEAGDVITRFFMDEKAADAYPFDRPLRSHLWTRIRGLLGPQGMLTQELSELVDFPVVPVSFECLRMYDRGLVGRVRDVSPFGMSVYRYFPTQEEADAWAREPGNSVAEKRETLKATKRAGRHRRSAELPKPMRAEKIVKQPEAPQPPGVPEQPKAPKARKAVTTTVLPPALQPGQPLITEQTKITRLASPLGRYEVEGSRVIGGFGTMRIGQYDRPASNWAQALAEAA